MVQEKTMPIPTPWFAEYPMRYTDSEMIIVYFTPTMETMKRILPEPLSPGLLGAVYLADWKNTPYGRNWEAALVVQCTLKEEYGIFFVSMFTDNIKSLIAHREIQGFPMKDAQFKYKREKDHIRARILRDKKTLITMDIDLEHPGDWIDAGTGINFKLIPNAAGKGYDVKQITATDLKFTIHEGRAGSAKISFGNTDDDPLKDLIQMENVVAGAWFSLELKVPYARILGEIKL